MSTPVAAVRHTAKRAWHGAGGAEEPGGVMNRKKRGSKLAQKAKKKGLSHAKINNIRKYKMAKRGEMTEAQRKRKKQEKKAAKRVTYAEMHSKKRLAKERKEKFDAEDELYPLMAEVSGEDMIKMMDPEDLSFLVEKKGVKRKQKGEKPLEGEEQYDNDERTFDEIRDGKKVRGLLPYKTDKGVIPRFREIEEPEEEEEEKEKEDAEEEEEAEEEEVPEEKSTIDFLIERQRKLDERKVKIGCLAANFIQQPEERLSGFSSLLHFLDEADPDIALTVKKYAALSLLEVFHKVIPSYPIQHHDLNMKLKKDTQQVFFYENHLLSGYQIYLKGLENMLTLATKKTKSPAMQSLGSVGVRCLGELLLTHTHFNFTTNILQALVPLLNHPHDPLSALAASYLTRLFKVDKMGYYSFETVKRVDHFVRRRSFRVRPEVLRVLLGLRMKEATSLDTIIEARLTTKRKMTHTEKLIRKVTEEQKRGRKSNKESKLFRKKRKLEEQMKGMKEEKAGQARRKQHSGLIQLVFGLYIHVLKRRPNNKLNGVVLEGLARFSHLINIEFFADLLNVLGVLMAEGSLKFRESLHCIQVVFTILAGQGEVLTLDPNRFFKYLYINMLKLSAGMNHGDAQSAVESLKQMLVEHRRKANPGRVLAFSKRLATLSLCLLHSGAIPALTTLRSITLVHPSVEALMAQTRRAPVECSPPTWRSRRTPTPPPPPSGNSTFWRLCGMVIYGVLKLVMRHYHSTVRQLAGHLLAGVPLQGEGTLPYTLTKRSLQELFDDYNPMEMRFNPAVPTPAGTSPTTSFVEPRNANEE
ncbi:Nucleolar complex protein 3 [Chionoecetes opilio]|uniref:NOC3-like protein n=1 Tax=Chionoecetes opilio TaxID=41210 RepID=A0A8J4YC73_CHIOP|nr:Nucleolar complex protein 3 [Chionoecetes opilio]